MRTRDQERALLAYECVAEVVKDRDDYKVAVNGLGANVMTNGLASALAFLQRAGRNANGQLLDHLARARSEALPKAANGAELCRKVRELDIAGYMLATREVLKLSVWFKRAVQATFSEQGA